MYVGSEATDFVMTLHSTYCMQLLTEKHVIFSHQNKEERHILV